MGYFAISSAFSFPLIPVWPGIQQNSFSNQILEDKWWHVKFLTRISKVFFEELVNMKASPNKWPIYE